MMNIRKVMTQIGRQASDAATTLALAKTADKKQALRRAAEELRASMRDILDANRTDVAAAESAGKSDAMLDRLRLDEQRVESIASGIDKVADLDDPVGRTLSQWKRPNGLQIQRVATPLGVIGVIYESRPNVTADAGALTLLSGNAAILRGGSDSFHSSTAIHQCLAAGLESTGLPAASIQLVPTVDRDAVGMMLAGLDGNVDVIVPRGGKSLVQRVQDESKVPVFAHLEGICHVYIDGEADREMAVSIVLNSKMRRTGICGAAETLLIDRRSVATHLQPILNSLQEKGCEIRGDRTVCDQFPAAKPADPSDWSTEYLDAIVSVRIVDGVEAAIDHIRKFSSGHTESIVTENKETAARFQSAVDSAIVAHNASTQFADGGEFGMGAEIGIATGRMHARGPIGVEQLTTFKYLLHGSGQTRP